MPFRDGRSRRGGLRRPTSGSGGPSPTEDGRERTRRLLRMTTLPLLWADLDPGPDGREQVLARTARPATTGRTSPRDGSMDTDQRPRCRCSVAAFAANAGLVRAFVAMSGRSCGHRRRVAGNVSGTSTGGGSPAPTLARRRRTARCGSRLVGRCRHRRADVDQTSSNTTARAGGGATHGDISSGRGLRHGLRPRSRDDLGTLIAVNVGGRTHDDELRRGATALV